MKIRLSSTFILLGVCPLLSFLRILHEAACCYGLVLQPPSKGSAAKPLEKKKVAVLGGGGRMGGLTFGFLQRACSLYGTGLGDVRCLGATAETAIRLNRILSKHFGLAVADESKIKLTNLHQSVESIQQRLQGWDALIMGNELEMRLKPVTANTFECSPNEKTWEPYWDGATMMTPITSVADEGDTREDPQKARDKIIQNILVAAKSAGIQHVVVVNGPQSKTISPAALQESGVPFTLLCPKGPLTDAAVYAVYSGLQGDLQITAETADTPSASDGYPISREDMAALCVQVLQTMDWTQSRILAVSCSGPLRVEASAITKKPNQEWCVNSHVLHERLARIV